MSLVERIQHLCSSKNTTLIGLEREIGLGRGTIRNWDRNSPSVDKLQKVADYFNVSSDYLLLGFDRSLLVQFVNSIKSSRSIEKFSKDTGVDVDELANICTGLVFMPPPLETLERIAASNPIEFIVDRSLLLKAAGYDASEKQPIFNTPKPLSPKEERDIARDLEKILGSLESNEALAFDGEPLDDETKELMRISLENSMRLAKQLAKKKFTPNKYK